MSEQAFGNMSQEEALDRLGIPPGAVAPPVADLGGLTYTGNGSKLLSVTATEDGLEFRFLTSGNVTTALGYTPTSITGLTGAQSVSAIRTGLSVPYVLAASAVAQAHTGDLTLTTMATVAVPANTLGANGFLRITAVWSWTNNANLKTTYIRFNGTSYYARSESTGLSNKIQIEIHNVNATNSQKGGPAGVAGGWGGVTGSPVTSAHDTTGSLNLTFLIQLANAGDTATLESYVVEAFYGA